MKKFRYLNATLIVIGIVSFSFIFLLKFDLSAQTTDTHDFQTSVTVGNSCPAISGSVVESVATVSTATSPTAIGSLVTWTTTATDPNAENYYLIICSDKTGTAVNSGVPTCGASRMYQISSSTASGSSATASYTTLASDPWLNQWYAYVCDSNAINAECCLVSAETGSANNETPFYVNHPPSFTAASSNTPRDPGQNVTWTTTASDPDTGSTVKLLVCKTQAISAGACTGGNWCTSTAVASNPTCSYLIPIPTADTTYNAWVYVVDQFNTPASGSGTKQGTASNFVVNNIAPVVSSVVLYSGAAITLAESSTKATPITATVTDNNGCGGGEITRVKAYVYRSGIGYTGCDTSGESNGNNCYPELTCSVGTCSDAAASYSCTANLQYYADPTTHNFCSIGGTTIQYYSQNWLATVKATDNNSLSGDTNSTGVEVNVLAAFSINPSSISYGNLSVGEKDENDPLDKTVVLTATGNSPFNVNLSGTNMCIGTSPCIAVEKQKFALVASTAYGSGTALTTSAAASGLGVPQINNGASTTKTTWWGITIPAGTIAGSYSGTNDIDSVFGGITTACP